MSRHGRPKNPEIDGAALRDARLNMCLSQAALGHRCGEDPRMFGPISDSVISSYESGRIRPSAGRLGVICRALGISEKDLLVTSRKEREAA